MTASSAALVALCAIALAAFGMYVVRDGGHFRFRATTPLLGVEAEGEIDTRHKVANNPPSASSPARRDERSQE